MDTISDGSQLEVYEFGDSPGLADELVGLILSGRKTATCCTMVELEKDGLSVPEAGEQKLVLNGAKEAVCIIELTEVEIKRFNEVDASFAYDEGEDDRSYESWRREHIKYFKRTLPEYGEEFSEDMELLCERFKVIKKL